MISRAVADVSTLGPGVVKARRPEPTEVSVVSEPGHWVRRYAWAGRWLLLSCDGDSLLWEVEHGPELTLSDEAFLDAFTECVIERIRDEAFCEP